MSHNLYITDLYCISFCGPSFHPICWVQFGFYPTLTGSTNFTALASCHNPWEISWSCMGCCCTHFPPHSRSQVLTKNPLQPWKTLLHWRWQPTIRIIGSILPDALLPHLFLFLLLDPFLFLLLDPWPQVPAIHRCQNDTGLTPLDKCWLSRHVQTNLENSKRTYLPYCGDLAPQIDNMPCLQEAKEVPAILRRSCSTNW